MRAIIWDFDGTLGYREGGNWAETLLEVIRRVDPGATCTPEDVRPLLAAGYYWHRHAEPHPEIRTTEAWWRGLRPVILRALHVLGYDGRPAERMADLVPATFADPSRWRLYPDALPTLDALAARGWTHHVLSNHVPELPDIARHLGLLGRLASLHNSAQTGYEKPHPRAFRLVLEAIGPAAEVWMVGDNPVADIAGAAAVGVPGILVHRRGDEVPYACDDLRDVPRALCEARRLRRPQEVDWGTGTQKTQRGTE